MCVEHSGEINCHYYITVYIYGIYWTIICFCLVYFVTCINKLVIVGVNFSYVTKSYINKYVIVVMGLLLLLYAIFNHPHLLIQFARVQKAQFSYRLDWLVP